MNESLYDDTGQCKYSEWEEVKSEKDIGATSTKTWNATVGSSDFILMAVHGH